MDTEEDYADPDEEEMNNIYHVLEGPIPPRRRGKRVRERKMKGRREGKQREEPLTEPTAYEVLLSIENCATIATTTI